jgi:hypothetical protein
MSGHKKLLQNVVVMVEVLQTCTTFPTKPFIVDGVILICGERFLEHRIDLDLKRILRIVEETIRRGFLGSIGNVSRNLDEAETKRESDDIILNLSLQLQDHILDRFQR